MPCLMLELYLHKCFKMEGIGVESSLSEGFANLVREPKCVEVEVEPKNCAISRIGTDYLSDGHKRFCNTITTTPTNIPEHSIMGLYFMVPTQLSGLWTGWTVAPQPFVLTANRLAFGPKFCPDRQPGSIRIIILLNKAVIVMVATIYCVGWV